MAYFDIHTHIAPQIDDGAKNDETALEMLKILYSSGVKHVILTPHYSERDGFSGDVFSALEKVKSLAEKVSPDMKIYPGNEIFYSSNVINLLKQEKIATLAGSRYVLVEFSYRISAEAMYSAVNELRMSGFRPIIAHVERYNCLYEKGVAEHLTDCGAYLQVNAQSIISAKLKTAHLIKMLLKNDLVSFIASDCHGNKERSPNMGKCISVINKKYGAETVNKIFFENPMRIVNDKRFN